MIDLLLDTHILIWWLTEPWRLSSAADAALRSSAGRWGLSTISLVEMTYLIERRRVRADVLPLALAAADANPAVLHLLPVDRVVAATVGQVPRPPVADMPDRIIAATAVAHRLPLGSADRLIRAAAGLTVVW